MSVHAAIRHLEQGQWQKAHDLVQDDESSPLACWAHGIVHLQEGDVSNARYWFARAKREFSTDVAAELAALVRAARAA